MNKLFIAFLTIMTVLLAIACKHHPDLTDLILPNDGGNGGTPDTVIIINPDPCDPDSVYFTNTILPILVSNCAMEDCHDAINPEEDVELYDYAHVMQQVSAGNLGNSDLWEAITEDDMDDIMPPTDNGGPLSTEEIDLIRTWILQGAQNNSCVADCDPTQGSFVNNIMPIIQQTCLGGCHAGSSPSGDLNLESYSNIQSVALDGRLMNSLHGTNGYTLMPDNTTGLPECYITQFQNWVDAGAPNN